jgi:transposase-like protein
MEEVIKSKKPFSPRASYTVAFKAQVIDDYFQRFKENSHETARQYKIDPSLVHRWLQSKDKINSSRGINVRKIRNKGGHFEEIEEELYNWIVNKRVIEKKGISYYDMRDRTKY